MRVAVAVSLLYACRFHFDAVGSGDDGSGSDDGDGGLVDPTGDATPISGTQVQLSPTASAQRRRGQVIAQESRGVRAARQAQPTCDSRRST